MAGAMRAAGFVEVDRRNQRSAIEALTIAHKKLHDSMSIWIAPEGTRSRTGLVGPFKKGGFRLAMLCGKSILPVTIDGTRKALPAGRLTVIRNTTVKVTISPPVDPARYQSEKIDNLIAFVKGAIMRNLHSISTFSESAEDEQWRA